MTSNQRKKQKKRAQRAARERAKANAQATPGDTATTAQPAQDTSPTTSDDDTVEVEQIETEPFSDDDEATEPPPSAKKTPKTKKTTAVDTLFTGQSTGHNSVYNSLFKSPSPSTFFQKASDEDDDSNMSPRIHEDTSEDDHSHSTMKLSIRDVDTIEKREIMTLKCQLKNDPKAFLAVMYEIHMLRDATQSTWSDVMKCSLKSPDGTITKIDLLSSFGKVNVEEYIAYSKTFWKNKSAKKKSEDGVSSYFGKRVFGRLLTENMDENLRRQLHQEFQRYKCTKLMRDGTLMWLLLAKMIFPSSHALISSLKDELKSLSVKSCSGNIEQYLDTFQNKLSFLAPDEELPDDIATSFFAQLIPCCLYEAMTIKFQMANVQLVTRDSTTEKLTASFFTQQIHDAQAWFRVSQMKLLPWLHLGKQSELMTFLSHLQEAHKAQMEIVALVTNLKTQFHQMRGYNTNKNKFSQKNNRQNPKKLPSYFNEKPDDESEQRVHNGSTYTWCDKCGKWSPSHSTAEHGKQSNHGKFFDRRKRPKTSSDTNTSNKKVRFSPPAQSQHDDLNSGLKKVQANLARNGEGLQALIRQFQPAGQHESAEQQ